MKAFLEERLAAAVAAGVPEERVQLDPGIGFGKTLEHNLELLRRLDEIVAIGRPVVLGTSRKTFIGRDHRPRRRRAGRTGRSPRACWGSSAGPRVFRVHDVAAVADGLAVAAATFAARWPATTPIPTRTRTTRT